MKKTFPRDRRVALPGTLGGKFLGNYMLADIARTSRYEFTAHAVTIADSTTPKTILTGAHPTYQPNISRIWLKQGNLQARLVHWTMDDSANVTLVFNSNVALDDECYLVIQDNIPELIMRTGVWLAPHYEYFAAWLE